ncbi:peptidylprolyl isomerase [Ornithobacterium rhinotracheale]
MALLEKIRKKTWLLIIGIGLPLVAFLVGDAFSRGSIFGNPNELGSAAGIPITTQDYTMEYSRISQIPQYQNAGENVISQITWNDLVSERVVSKHAEKLGVEFSEQQYFEAAAMFFSSIQPNLIAQNGAVNVEATKAFLSELKTAAQTGNPQAQAIYQQWENANPQAAMLRASYLDFVSRGVLATDAEAEFAFQGNNTQSQISYAFVDYATFKQKNNIQVTDEQVLDYLKAHKKQFKPEASVNIAYAYFPAVASNQDTQEIISGLNKFLNQQVITDPAAGITDTIQAFANAKNDSVYVSRFSEDVFDPTYYTKSQIENLQDANIKNLLSNLEVGKVYGPIKNGNLYELIKVTNAKPIADSVKSSHILISFQGAQGGASTRSPQAAQQIADSILNVVKTNPAKFNELASTFSDDKVAAKENGSIGWVGRFQQNFDPSYREYILSHDKGSFGVVPSQFGFHVIRIDDVKSKMGYQFAVIKKVLKASEETQEQLFNKANQLALDMQGKNTNDFVNAARKTGAEVNNADGVARFEANVTGLTGTNKLSDILAWAFNPDTKSGSIERFETSNGGQIVVFLSNKFDKDQYNVAAYKGILTPIIEADLAYNKAKELVGNDKDLNSISKKLGGRTGQASGITYNTANIEGIGAEPTVGAAALALPKGGVSNVLKAVNGIFVVKVDSKTVGAKKEDLSNERRVIELQNMGMIQNSLLQSLIDDAKVVDKRAERLVK